MSGSCQACQLRFGYFQSHKTKTAMMRAILNHTAKTSENAHRCLKGVRAVLFGLVVFVMAVQGVALALSRAQAASHEGVAGVSTAASVDCAREDSRAPSNDGRAHQCSLAGLCCLASCERQTSFGLAGTAFSAAAFSRSATDRVEPSAPVRRRVRPAGWASAWSSRAPPQTA